MIWSSSQWNQSLFVAKFVWYFHNKDKILNLEKKFWVTLFKNFLDVLFFFFQQKNKIPIYTFSGGIIYISNIKTPFSFYIVCSWQKHIQLRITKNNCNQFYIHTILTTTQIRFTWHISLLCGYSCSI